MIQIRLLHVNPFNEKHWFVSLGDPWPHLPELRLIRRTTKNKSRAKVFSTAGEAAKTLEMCGNPPGWSISTE